MANEGDAVVGFRDATCSSEGVKSMFLIYRLFFHGFHSAAAPSPLRNKDYGQKLIIFINQLHTLMFTIPMPMGAAF
jgi:hypothetical protein